MNLVKAAKAGVERRMTSGNLWTIAVMVASIVGGTGYNHFNPPAAVEAARSASESAVARSDDTASKAAVIAERVTVHSQQIATVLSTMQDLNTSVAVLKAQSDEAKTERVVQDAKLDRILEAVYRMQGRSQASNAPAAGTLR